jgi:membrane protein involved in colicin uptake
MGHIVTATLIVAKTGKTEQYFEKGATLPTGVSAEERKRLVAAGLIAAVEEAPKADSDAEQTAAAEAAAKAAAEAKAEADAKTKAAAAAKTAITK